MPNETVSIIKQEKAAEQIKRMHKYLYEANSVTATSLRKALESAQVSVYIAKGFYNALNGLGILSDGNVISEDIERVDAKIKGILEENQNEAIRRHMQERRK